MSAFLRIKCHYYPVYSWCWYRLQNLLCLVLIKKKVQHILPKYVQHLLPIRASIVVFYYNAGSNWKMLNIILKVLYKGSFWHDVNTMNILETKERFWHMAYEENKKSKSFGKYPVLDLVLSGSCYEICKGHLGIDTDGSAAKRKKTIYVTFNQTWNVKCRQLSFSDSKGKGIAGFFLKCKINFLQLKRSEQAAIWKWRVLFLLPTIFLCIKI